MKGIETDSEGRKIERLILKVKRPWKNMEC